jgi:hypothetical protein
VRACAHALPARLRARLRARLPACVPACVPACLPACLPACPPACPGRLRARPSVEMHVVRVRLDELDTLSSVRVLLPTDVRAADERHHVLKSALEVLRRFEGAPPTLDARDDLAIHDATYHKAAKKVRGTQPGAQARRQAGRRAGAQALRQPGAQAGCEAVRV